MGAGSSKQAAGKAAADLVRDGVLLGLGTGSTVDAFLEALARRIQAEGITVKGVPTSAKTAQRAEALGIPLTSLDEAQELDLVVDGADEADPQLRLIKGGGGALLREKIVASAGKHVIIIIGEGKRVPRLGTGFLLPVEVLPFGSKVVTRHVAGLGCQPFLRASDTGAPFVTDNGNWILDCRFADGIADPEGLHSALSQVPGVVGVGLFLNLCDLLIEGRADGGTRTYTRT
ncbi:MAG: ribose-5-phosphate isomerase RpiA [Planctomycetota bacterium]|nr:MAG: ribose-5-phosphate isomerase RpiA [Planctomycetota bacterium]